MLTLLHFALCMGLAASAWGAGFAGELRSCNAALRAGKPAEALEGLRALQVERPDSPWVLYALGAAQHQLGRGHAVAQENTQAVEAFEAAARYFGKAAESDLPELRRAALFNGANAVVQAGMTQKAGDNRAGAIERLESAIGRYEALLREYPVFAPGLQNLDAVRYRLKQWLREAPQQEPPPEGNEDRESRNQESSSADGQEQDDKRAEPDSRGQEQADASQEPEAEAAQEEASDKQEAPQQPRNEQQAEQQAGSGNSGENESLRAAEADESPARREDGQPRASKLPRNGPQRLDRASIEALLESLEEVDRDVQRERHSGPRDTRVPREWW
jgi:hypothetical protein